jgi:hypothetical protein
MRIVRLGPPLDFMNSKDWIDALAELHDLNERNYYHVLEAHFFRHLERIYFPEVLGHLHKMLNEGNIPAATKVVNDMQDWYASLKGLAEELNQ